MRLLDHVLDDVVVDQLDVAVVLPEGASDVQLETPYPVTRRLVSGVGGGEGGGCRSLYGLQRGEEGGG